MLHENNLGKFHMTFATLSWHTNVGIIGDQPESQSAQLLEALDEPADIGKVVSLMNFHTKLVDIFESTRIDPHRQS